MYESPDFNPRSPRGERRCGAWRRRRHSRISIHAPRGGSDHSRQGAVRCVHISIHAPRGGSDAGRTPEFITMSNFNPRSPRGERRKVPKIVLLSINFNPRSPRGERLPFGADLINSNRFQSTLPAGGATYQRLIKSPLSSIISIHAPRGGSDNSFLRHFLTTLISIHAPRGGSDTPRSIVFWRFRIFQSTLPAGGATCVMFSFF